MGLSSLSLAAKRPFTPVFDLARHGGTSAYTRFCIGSIWSFVGTVLAQGSVLIASVLVAQILGKGAFGALGIIQGTAGALGIFAGIGSATTCAKYVAELRFTDPRRAGEIIGLSMVVSSLLAGALAIGLYLSAPWLASRTLAAPGLTGGLRIVTLLLFLMAISGVQNGTLAGLEAFRPLAKLSAIRGGITLVLMVVAARSWGLQGVIWSLTIAAGVGCVLGHAEVQRCCATARIKIHFLGSLAERAVIWRFSIPAFLAGAMTGPVTWLAYSILVNQPEGYGQMGVFNAANHWRNVVLFIPGVIGQPLLPILSDLYGRRSADFRRVLWAAIALVGGVATLLAIPISLAAPWILHLYGHDFRPSWPVLSLLVASAVPAACCSVIGQAIAGSGNVWSGFLLNLLWAAVLLGMAVLLTGRGGATGLSLAFLCAYSIHAVTVSAAAISFLRSARNPLLISAPQ